MFTSRSRTELRRRRSAHARSNVLLGLVAVVAIVLPVLLALGPLADSDRASDDLARAVDGVATVARLEAPQVESGTSPTRPST